MGYRAGGDADSKLAISHALINVWRLPSMAAPETREEWIVREARKRPLAERASFLDGACGGDEALRQRLESLLATPEPSETHTPTSQETKTVQPTMKLDFAETPGEAVGQMI